jgi:hypothetical protein
MFEIWAKNNRSTRIKIIGRISNRFQVQNLQVVSLIVLTFSDCDNVQSWHTCIRVILRAWGQFLATRVYPYVWRWPPGVNFGVLFAPSFIPRGKHSLMFTYKNEGVNRGPSPPKCQLHPWGPTSPMRANFTLGGQISPLRVNLKTGLCLWCDVCSQSVLKQ